MLFELPSLQVANDDTLTLPEPEGDSYYHVTCAVERDDGMWVVLMQNVLATRGNKLNLFREAAVGPATTLEQIFAVSSFDSESTRSLVT